jgi:hypothetical protein
MNAVSQISSEMSAALALDLASEVWPESTVFQNHGVDPIYGAALLQQAWFRKMVDEAKREWSSISSAKERIKLKSQIAVEQALGDLYAIVTDKTTPAAARVAAFKELKDVAGVAINEQAGPMSTAPTVNIFLNGDTEPAFSVSSSKTHRDAEETDFIEVTPSNQDDADIFGMAPL